MLQVFKALRDMMPAPPAVTKIVTDFERGIWAGAISVFPDCQMRGCVFHWTQAVWRKVQENGLQVILSLHYNI